MRITWDVITDGYYSNLGETNPEWALDSAREYVYGMGGTSWLVEKHDGEIVKITRYYSEYGGDGEQSTDEVVEETVVYTIK